MTLPRNTGESFEEEAVRRVQQKIDQVYEDLCELSNAVKKERNDHTSVITEAPVISTDTSLIQNENSLVAKQMEIEDLKKQIQEVEAEIEVTRKEKSSKSRHAAQCCKLITGLVLTESEGQFVGVSVKDPLDGFTFDAKDPQVATKLWNKVYSK